MESDAPHAIVDRPSSAASAEQRCPECASPRVVSDGGCATCRSCGWSRCAYSPH